MAVSFLTILLVLALTPLPALSAKCNEDDKKALLAIDAHFHYPYHFASWTNDTPCCQWYDVHCDPTTGRVVRLRVTADSNLTGTLPAAIGHLPFLALLTFRKLPKLVGPIPSSFAKLTRLSFIDLSRNSLSGPIPSSLSQLPSLTYITLAFNHFSGSIPPSLADLTNLQALLLESNRLTGPIPAQINQLTGLVLFNVSYNRLCGEIPSGSVTAKFDQSSYFHNKCLCGPPLPACK